MKASKEQIIKAIDFFLKTFGIKENYSVLIPYYAGTPKLIEMIVYEMFLHEFNPCNCTDEEYEQYNLIYEYTKELKQNGEVIYE